MYNRWFCVLVTQMLLYGEIHLKLIWKLWKQLHADLSVALESSQHGLNSHSRAALPIYASYHMVWFSVIDGIHHNPIIKIWWSQLLTLNIIITITLVLGHKWLDWRDGLFGCKAYVGMTFIIIRVMCNRYNVLLALIMHEIDLTYISIPHIYTCFFLWFLKKNYHYLFVIRQIALFEIQIERT